MQGAEHPPIHVHLLHPNGKAVIGIDGGVINSGVPATVLTEAMAWILDNIQIIVTEWHTMGNLDKRQVLSENMAALRNWLQMRKSLQLLKLLIGVGR